MEKIGDIEIRVQGKTGNLDLTPASYDIKEIGMMLQSIEDLLFPTNKKERPIITHNIEEGSVRHLFKTSIQAVIGFSAVLTQVNELESIDFLELKTAQAIENIQNLAIQKNYSFDVKTSVKSSVDYELRITPQTHFIRTENTWAEAELYFYGMLTNAGGKAKANIHIDTEEFGSITIDTNKEFLQEKEENLLYKKFGVRASGKQNVETGEIDKSSLKLIELVDYNARYDDEYLNRLISKAKKNWKNIDPDEWLNNLRGGYEA
jgi:hypothetical protein